MKYRTIDGIDKPLSDRGHRNEAVILDKGLSGGSDGGGEGGFGSSIKNRV